MPLVPMHAVWPWHWRGGAGRSGSCFSPFFLKRHMNKIYSNCIAFFLSAGFKPYREVHSAILLRFWSGLLTIHALQEKATLCHLAYAPTRARDVETLPNMPRLQLKRSLEAATRAESDMSDAPCGRRLLCIWRMALEVRMFFRAFKLNRFFLANEKVWEAYRIPSTN